MSGSNAFVLDAKGGRVISVPIGGGAPTVAFADGETYGGTPAKKPIFLSRVADAAAHCAVDF